MRLAAKRLTLAVLKAKSTAGASARKRSTHSANMPTSSSPLLISFSTLACPDWTFGQIASNGGAYGYDGVEIRMIEGQTDLLARPEFAESALEMNLNML